MIDLKKYKEYGAMVLCAVLFIASLIYLGILYISWDKPLDSKADVVEVNLPVIEWAKYMELSKQY